MRTIMAGVLSHKSHSQTPGLKMRDYGNDPNKWCKFQKVKGHHTNHLNHLKKSIKCLIQEEHL